MHVFVFVHIIVRKREEEEPRKGYEAFLQTLRGHQGVLNWEGGDRRRRIIINWQCLQRPSYHRPDLHDSRRLPPLLATPALTDRSGGLLRQQITPKVFGIKQPQTSNHLRLLHTRTGMTVTLSLDLQTPRDYPFP